MTDTTRALLKELSEYDFELCSALHDKYLARGVSRRFLLALWRSPRESRRLLCTDALKNPIYHAGVE